MPAITCNASSSDRSSDPSSDSVIYLKEILYNNVYLRVEPLVLHDLVRGASFSRKDGNTAVLHRH